jgi:NAD(P)-dependent dehydrogenase (short-subunit alcohol dehydrogenase family)
MANADWMETPALRLHLPDLKGKTALITGSSQGIGKATAEVLLENGTQVFGIARGTADAKQEGLIFLDYDLTDPAAIAAAFQEIEKRTDRLDFVVNVAGIDPKYSIDHVTLEQWNELIDLNLRAYYFIIKRALPLLRKGEGRSIVNVSSINYRLGVPGRAAYSATKAGILGLTTGLSRELGQEGIRINTITPGWIFTERQIREYFGAKNSEKHLEYLAQRQSMKIKITAADIANHIVFYLSGVSRASIGHNCIVDGGWLLE